MSFTTDATSGIGIPQTSAEWGDASISPYLDTPDHLWKCQEASNTSLADTIGSVTWNKASNAMLWQQTLSGWTQKGILISALNGGTINGFTSTASALHPTSQSVMYLWYIKWNGTPTVAATIMQLGGTVGATQTILRILTQPTSVVSVGTANLVETNGTKDPNAYSANGGVQPVIIQYDRTNEVYRVFLGQEVITTTYFAVDGTTTKSIGSINSTPCGPFYILYGACWVGSKAEKADWQIRGGLDALGWAATSTPFFPVTFTAGLVDNTSTDHRLDVAASDIAGVATSTVVTSDSMTAVLTAQPSLAEALTTAEAFAATFQAVQPLSESVSTAEQLDALLQAAPALAETDATTEQIAVIASYVQGVSDSETVTEQLDAFPTAAIAVSESESFGEAVGIAAQSVVGISESETLTDSNAVGATYVANVGITDGPTITDSIATGQIFQLALATETVTTNEIIDVQATLTQVASAVQIGEFMGYFELGRTLRQTFVTRDRLGQVVDADSLPTAVAMKQGVAMGYTPTINHITTGTYELVLTVTAGNGFEVDKEVATYLTAVINGLTVRVGGPSFIPQNFSSDDIMERVCALGNRKAVHDGGSGHPNIQRSGDGFATFIRVRVFADSKDLSTVTKGAADNADGELFRYTYTGVEDGSTGRLGNMTMDVALEPSEP